MLWLNQLSFVLALDATTATTIGLLLGAIPIFTALLGLALGRERLKRRFWIAAAISAVGRRPRRDRLGRGRLRRLPRDLPRPRDVRDVGRVLGRRRADDADVLGVARERRRDPRSLGADRARRAYPRRTTRTGTLGWEIWALVVLATLGPLVLTNILWFRSLDRVGPSRATLAVNLQPFVAALLAVVLLSEPLSLLQVLGGVLIAAGLVVARRRTAPAQAT